MTLKLKITPRGKSQLIDRTGMRIGRLVLLELHSLRPTKWLAKCDCGKITLIRGSQISSGATKSCGCFNIDKIIERNTTHGMASTRNGGSQMREYRIWKNMKSRCLNKNVPSYSDYGGRGIRVCKRWLNSFENFIQDMGLPPSNRHTIDRKNNAGGYSPSNCKWSTQVEQANNRRGNISLTHEGITLTIAQWAAKVGVRRSLIADRINLGWNPSLAITKPVQSQYGPKRCH